VKGRGLAAGLRGRIRIKQTPYIASFDYLHPNPFTSSSAKRPGPTSLLIRYAEELPPSPRLRRTSRRASGPMRLDQVGAGDRI
jgi:hypothetical protein